MAKRTTTGKTKKPTRKPKTEAQREAAKERRKARRRKVTPVDTEGKTPYEPDEPPKSKPKKNICGGKKPGGRLCRSKPGQGTDHPGVGRCKNCGGDSPSGIRAASVVIGTDMLPRSPVMGVPIDINPHDALTKVVTLAAGELEYCNRMIAELSEDELWQRDDSRKREWGEGEKGSKDMKTIERTEKRLNRWIRARHQCMDRLAKFSKMAIDAGVAEAHLQLAQGQAVMFAEILDGIFKELKLTDRQAEIAPSTVRKHLLLLEGGDPLASEQVS